MIDGLPDTARPESLLRAPRRPRGRISLTWAVLLLGPMFACAQNGLNNLAPRLDVQGRTPPDASGRHFVDFGSVLVGQSSQQSVTALDVGKAPLTLQALVVPAPFAVDATSIATIPRAGRLDLAFTFTPAAMGPFEQTVVLQSNGGSATIVLRGVGSITGSCDYVLTPMQLDFGTGVVGQPQTAAVQFANLGSADCDLSGIRIDPTSDPSFALAAGQVTSATVSSTGGSFPLSVTFTPSQAGASLTGRLNITVGPGGAMAQIPLSGTAVATPCQFQVQPTQLDFVGIVLGTTPSQTVQVLSTSTAACTVSNVRIKTGSDSSFALAAGQAVSGQPTSATPFPIVATYTPTTATAGVTGSIAFDVGPPGKAVEVPLAAFTAPCTFTVQPALIDFGRVAPLQTATQTFQITATGPVPCDIKNVRMDPAGNSAFSLGAGQATAGTSTVSGSFAVSLTFAPIQTGPLISGAVLFDVGPPSASHQVTLTGLSNTCTQPWPDGTCPVATAPIYLSDGSSLYTFDPTTHATSMIGNLVCSDGEDMEDIAIDNSGSLWAVDDEFPWPELYAVNPTTGDCRPVLSLQDPGGAGLTFLSDGSLAAAGNSVEIPNLMTGNVTRTIVPAGRFQTSGDLVALPDGMLYWTVTGPGGDQLVRIDPSSGATTVLSTLGAYNVMLAYANGSIYGFTRSGQLLIIDPATGASTVGSLPGSWIGAATNPAVWH